MRPHAACEEREDHVHCGIVRAEHRPPDRGEARGIFERDEHVGPVRAVRGEGWELTHWLRLALEEARHQLAEGA